MKIVKLSLVGVQTQIKLVNFKETLNTRDWNKFTIKTVELCV